MGHTRATLALLFSFSIFDASIATAQTDNQYLAVSTIYQANGELLTGGASQVFASAAECDRFISARIDAAIQKVGRSKLTLLGDSVVMPRDDSGFFWFGCIHPTDYSTAAYVRYIDTPMTPQRGRQMKRFPNLSG